MAQGTHPGRQERGARGNRIVRGIVGVYDRAKLSIATLFGVFLIWWVVSEFFNPRGDPYLPSPDYVLDRAIFFQDELVAGVLITSFEILLGFVAGVTIGIVVGIIMAESFLIRQTTLPSTIFIYSVPHALFAPLFALWFGTNLFTIVLFISWFAFYMPFINTMTGFTQTRQEFYYLGDVVGATRWQMIKYIKIWEALPNISSAIKISAQGSVIGAIIAEFIIAARGLGYLVINSYEIVRMGLMFAALIVIIALALVFFNLVGYLLEQIVPGATGDEDLGFTH